MITAEEDLLTVVLLTYNHEKTIAKAFDSILEQITDFNFTILVLEDCSTDSTASICQKYYNKYKSKIVLKLNQRNLGVAENLKQGLCSISSKYIAFLEGDDYWCDNSKLQIQVDLLQKNRGCSICGHNTLCQDHGDGSSKLFLNETLGSGSINIILTKEDNCRVHPSSRLYRNYIDLKKIPAELMLDTHIFRLFINSGNLLYIPRVMSVFNDYGKGFWTGRSYWNKRLLNLQLSVSANNFYDFKYESDYLKGSKLLNFSKKLFGIKLGWRFFSFIENLRLRLHIFLE